MKTHEQLQDLIPHFKVYYADTPKGLLSLIVKDEIYLNTNQRNSYHATEILAEEVAHYLTTTRDISNYRDIKNMKEEVRARRFAYQLVVPLEKLVECYKLSIWGDLYEMCLHLEIDRSYFAKVIEDYKTRFESYVRYKNYKITFFPRLEIKPLNLSSFYR